jgi:hypothetical protein
MNANKRKWKREDYAETGLTLSVTIIPRDETAELIVSASSSLRTAILIE